MNTKQYAQALDKIVQHGQSLQCYDKLPKLVDYARQLKVDATEQQILDLMQAYNITDGYHCEFCGEPISDEVWDAGYATCLDHR